MSVLARDKDTICAISTPSGVGGIALIRISGDLALYISRKLCPFLPIEPESHRIYYGFAQDNRESKSIDEVLVSYFAKGRSFTGEETIEISCHGGNIITGNIIKALQSAGARLAERGEFTYRSFLSGRIDLVQAESVLNLIEASTDRGSRLALRQLGGELSTFAEELENSLHWILAHLEANIDFAYEDIESASKQDLLSKLDLILEISQKALISYKSGRLIKEGLQVALIGPPNAGKSSLLNALLNEEKSIVSDIPGTTRDLVEGSLLLSGVRINFVDTAGVRDTNDPLEILGIERTYKTLKSADLIWFLVDLGAEAEFSGLEALRDLNSDRVWIVGTKSDLIDKNSAMDVLLEGWQRLAGRVKLEWTEPPLMTFGNSVHENGLKGVLECLTRFAVDSSGDNSVILIQARHHELFVKICASLQRGRDLLKKDESPDFIAFELQEALLGIHELLGKRFDDEVLDRVFKEFCLGK